MLLLNENSIHASCIITMSLVHAHQKTISKQYILHYLDLFLGTLILLIQSFYVGFNTCCVDLHYFSLNIKIRNHSCQPKSTVLYKNDFKELFLLFRHFEYSSGLSKSENISSITTLLAARNMNQHHYFDIQTNVIDQNFVL